MLNLDGRYGKATQRHCIASSSVRGKFRQANQISSLVTKFSSEPKLNEHFTEDLGRLDSYRNEIRNNFENVNMLNYSDFDIGSDDCPTDCEEPWTSRGCYASGLCTKKTERLKTTHSNHHSAEFNQLLDKRSLHEEISLEQFTSNHSEEYGRSVEEEMFIEDEIRRYDDDIQHHFLNLNSPVVEKPPKKPHRLHEKEIVEETVSPLFIQLILFSFILFMFHIIKRDFTCKILLKIIFKSIKLDIILLKSNFDKNLKYI